MGHEVLEDDLLQVPVLGVDRGESFERRASLLAALADADEDPAREWNPLLAGRADRLQPARGMLRRRALMGDEVRIDRLEHQALRGGHLAQPREVVPAEHAKVGVRQQPLLERPLADPHDIGDEVLEAQRPQLCGDAGIDLRALARQHQKLLDPMALDSLVEQRQHLVGLVEMRLMRRERAVLAVAPARPGQRQREIAAERNPTTHARTNPKQQGCSASPSRVTLA